MPWMADHEFPHSPDSVCEDGLGGCPLAERWKKDEGVEVRFIREAGAAAAAACACGPGDTFLEPSCDAALLGLLSLPSVA